MTFDWVDFTYTDYGSFYGAYVEKNDPDSIFGHSRVTSFNDTREANSFFSNLGVAVDIPYSYDPSKLDTICKAISETLGVKATHNDCKDVS